MFKVRVRRNPKAGVKGRGTKVIGLVLEDPDGRVVRERAVDMRAMKTQEDVFGATQELLREALPDGEQAVTDRYGWRFVRVGGEVRVLDAGTVERPLSEVAVRELRNDVSSVLRRVADRGERLRITANGRAIAELVPLLVRREAVPWRDVMEGLAGRRADAGLLDDLRTAVPDMVDEIGVP
jgi:prevent-host-death family protein